MAQMQTVSIRLPDEDFQWLLSSPYGVGKTPSEKLRGLVSRVRQQESGLADIDVCTEWMRSLVQPLISQVGAWERQQKQHSELMSAVLDAVPRIMALLVSARPETEEARPDAGDLREVEAVLAQQCFHLLTTLLRAAVTSTPAVYDRVSIERYLPDIIEIMEIIATRKEKELKNG